MTEGTPAAPSPSAAPAAPAAAPAAPAAAPASGTPIPVTMPNRPADTPVVTGEPPAAPTPPAGGEAPKTGETPPAPNSDPNAPAPATDFKLPDEYKDKPWAAKIKTQDDLYKQLDNLDKLVGKKGIPPDLAKATPEEREAFYAQLRPASVDEYKFPDTGTPMPPEMKTAVQEMFMKNGISAVQANDIITAYNALGEQQTKAMFDPQQFEQTLESAFGKDWKPVVANIRGNLKGMMSEADQKALDNLPNAYLAVVYRTLGNVAQKFGVKETDGAHFNGPGNAGTVDINAQRDSIRNEMRAMSSRPHTAQELAALRTKLADTYKNDPRIQQGA